MCPTSRPFAGSRGPHRLALAGVLALLAFGFAAQPVSAQQAATITGTVADSAGVPIAGAHVLLLSLERRAVTDSAGRFRLVSVPVGRHRLHVSRLGFAPGRLEVTVPDSGSVSGLLIALHPTPLALPSVQVTGISGSRDPLAVAQATTHVDGAALQRELGSTVAHTLRTQPGIAMRSMGPAATMPVVRGLTGDRILILQDGQRSADLAGSADDHGLTLDPLSVERVEVVRGPATLLYGNNAAGGVVNVITRDIPSEVPHEATWSVSGQSETAFPGAAVSAATTVPVGNSWAATARAGLRHSSDMRIPGTAGLTSRLTNTDSRSRNLSAGLGYHGLRVAGGASAQVYDFTYGLPVAPDADPVRLDGMRREARGQLDYRTGLPLLPLVKLKGTVQNYRHNELDEAGNVLQQFNLGTQAADLMVRQGSIGRVTDGSWGASALFKDYSASGPTALTPPATSRGIGVFTFQSVSLGRPVLELGARVDDYRIESRSNAMFGPGTLRTYQEFSWSTGLRVPLRQRASLAASIVRSFRAPTVEELFSKAAHAGTGAVEIGNPDLAAERGIGAEVVLRVQDAKWNGQFSTYQQRISNYVLLQARGDTLLAGTRYPVLSYEQGTAILRGVEGSVEWAPTSALVLGLMGDALHARDASGEPLSYMPPARLGVSARWARGAVSLGGDLHHEFRQGRVGAADELPTPAHTLVRLHAGYTFNLNGQQHSISLRAENIGNQVHREATSRVKDFAPGPGRNLALVWRLSRQGR